MTSDIRIIGLKAPADITPGVDLAAMIVEAAEDRGLSFSSGDILVVTQKIVSKAEGQLVDLHTITPSPFAEQIATTALGGQPVTRDMCGRAMSYLHARTAISRIISIGFRSERRISSTSISSSGWLKPTSRSESICARRRRHSAGGETPRRFRTSARAVTSAGREPSRGEAADTATLP